MTNFLRKTYNFAREYIDWKKGALFGSLAGVAVGAINYNKGIEYAFTSGSKEAAKCLAIGTMNLSVCQTLARKIENRTKALVLATIIPTLLSVGLTYGVHKCLRGTPYPERSTAPTALAAPFFYLIGRRARNLMERNTESKLVEEVA
jgi:hypothetical protein